ncbi:DUF3892 domain-containing protein [Thalassotalea agariperforans]
MAQGSSINGNGSGSGSGNDSYTIKGRGVVSRPKIVKEVLAGKHPDTHIYSRNGMKYARNNRNCNLPDNIND